MQNKYILYTAFVLYTISMFLPGIAVAEINEQKAFVLNGYWILFIGWIAFAEFVFSWYANPIFLYIVFFGKREHPKIVLVASVISFILGLTALWVHDIPAMSEAGGVNHIDHLAIGYYVWMVSLGLLVLYGFMRYRHLETNSEAVMQTTGVDFPALLERHALQLIGLVFMLAMLAYVLLK